MRTRNKQTLINKVISMLLCLVLVLSNLPAGMNKVYAAEENRVVDEHTLDQWKNFFGVQDNNPQNVALTTEYAGGVWTDKSVFIPTNIPSQLTDAKYNGKTFPLEDKSDNFLVSLSAMASNKQIKGYSTLPTDTVLILDLSSSMRSADSNRGSALDELADATNEAIRELMELNKNNRVAVVIYAGNTNKTFSDAQGITRVMLPLDSYTSSNDKYLVSVAVGNTANDAIAVSSTVRNSDNQTINVAQFQASKSTYMQDGIYEAMRVFLDADPVVKSGVQKGTSRLPIMVLMTDGEPTLANTDYNGNDARTDLGTSEMYDYEGSTGTYGHRDTIAFVTSLTAAFAKKQIASHYGEDALMYTLAYGSAVANRTEALSILNPVKASTIQNNLWNDFLDDKAVTVYRSGSRNNYTYKTVRNSTVEKEHLSQADRLYVDKYFDATTASDDAMMKAFQEIVAEIMIQSKYYPTYVEKDYDHDGYLTFVDKIGSYMEVSDIKGIVVGNRLFSGAALAQKFNSGDLGTIENPKALGDELVYSVKERLSITDTATARAVLNNAYTHGQLRYTSDDDFEHYIGWFSNAQGDYVDAWHEGMTDAQIQSVVQNAGATHIMRSYGFLGDTTVVPGMSNTDMMYMTVRVATEIATGESIVTWKIPASLVPTITYDVDVEVNSDGEITKLIGLEIEKGTAESPIRLLYEVELRKDIEDWNLTEKVDSAYVNENGYTFYSNKWNASAEDTSQNTYSHFEPSVQNERYYYTQDTVVLQKTGTDTYAPYTGSSKPTGSGYYHSLRVFEKLNNGSYRIHMHYEPITSGAMESVKKANDNQWVIPKDTIHRYYDYEVAEKTQNETGTMGYSDHPFVVKEDSIYYTYSTQGNNGKLTMTPATGIALTKKLEEGFTTQESFTFVIDGNVSGAQVVRLDENGNEESRSALPSSKEVKLNAGETVYVIGLQAGTYTITEKMANGSNFKVTSIMVNGQSVNGTSADVTLTNQTIIPVEFTNGEFGYGSLVVSKDVKYPEGFTPTSAHDNKEFTVKITFDKDVSGVSVSSNAQINGRTYTISLNDGEAVTFTGIPEGTSYTVEETDIPNGYYVDQNVRYTDSEKLISANDEDQVHLVNEYRPDAASVNLTVKGTKTVSNGEWPNGATFKVKLLEEKDFGSGDFKEIDSATVTKTSSGYEIDFSQITFDKVGIYYYRVVEDIPSERIQDMAYDRSYGLFSVTVDDANADGKLEVTAVNSYQNTELSGNATNGYVITKDFNNVVTKDIVYLDVTKKVTDASGKNYTENLADITFGLFDSMNSQTPKYYILTDKNGETTFAIPVTKDELGTEGKVYYLREIAPAVENRVVGMKYDESWIGALKITWDENENKAVSEYAKISNNTVGNYSAYDRNVFSIEHKNIYDPGVGKTPAITLSGVKTLNGKNDLGGRTFSFSLYKTTADFVIQDEANDLLQTATTAGNTFTFTNISFDTPGMHYLSVKENATSYGGVTNEHKHYHISVLVEKYAAQDGVTHLRVANGYPHIVVYGSEQLVNSNELNFNNTYTITGNTSVTIEATKKLIGREMLSGEFTFLLEEVNDASGTPKQNGLSLRAENGMDVAGVATVQFEKIEYTEVGTYYYKVSEQKGTTDNGVTYSNDTFIVEVKVEDNNEGGLKSSWSVVNGSSIEFTNTYKPSATYDDLSAGKELSGRLLSDGEFEFELIEMENGFAKVKSNGVYEKVKNDANGLIDFTRLHYDQEGSYYYVIREVVPSQKQPGITYDETEYQVTIRVTDDKKGKLNAFKSIEMIVVEDGDPVAIPVSSIVFYNKYTISGTASVKLMGTKTLTGKELVDDMFTFELYQTNSEYATDGVAPTTTTNKEGKFSFELEYKPEDVGSTFYYVVKEKDAGKTIDDITYSTAQYKVKVEVKDDGNGGIETVIEAKDLEVKVEGKEVTVTDMAFENSYYKAPTPEPTPTPSPTPETPKTGDGNNILMWYALLFISGGSILGTTIYKKKREDEI